MSRRFLTFALSLVALAAPRIQAEVRVTADHNAPDDATPAFAFKTLASPLQHDAAPKAAIKVIDGAADEGGGSVDVLHDGALPKGEDDPSGNFFFAAGTPGGRLLVDLGLAINVKIVNTYSWHDGNRAPQVYALYASDGAASNFSPAPGKGIKPSDAGWKLIAEVDTRPKDGPVAGQYAVSVADSAGDLGHFRYLLFDVSATETNDRFGNTFFSEINILDAATPIPVPKPVVGVKTFQADGGKFRFTLDTSETPDLTAWAERDLAPVVQAWYPKIVAMLPSEGYTAPTHFSITVRKDMDGVAYTAGTNVVCAGRWMADNRDSEARGAVVHELVHVVQQYGRQRRAGARTPGWIVEGIPDYIRWYKYEPQSGGADLSPAALAQAKYDGSYRVSANFINFVSTTFDKDLVRKLNAVMRAGKYTADFWKDVTGKSLDELNEQWKHGEEKHPAQ